MKLILIKIEGMLGVVKIVKLVVCGFFLCRLVICFSFLIILLFKLWLVVIL